MSFVYSDDGTVVMRFPAISSIKIPSKVVGIYGESGEDYASIDAANKLESVTFESSSQLKYIGKYAFYKCTLIKTIDLSPCSCLEKIHDYGFNYCTGITSITLPKSVLSRIESYVFQRLSISSILIPASVEYIGESTFSDCQNLESIIFEEGSKLYDVGRYAFPSNQKFTNITFPKSYGKYSHSFCNSLYIENVFVEEGNEKFRSIDGVLYGANNKSLFYFPRARTGSYKILDGVETIEYVSFTGTSLSYVIFPDSLKKISTWAFSSGKIKAITIPASCTFLGEYCFNNCKELENITIPDSVTTLGTCAFRECTKLTEIRLPSNLSSIGGGLFLGCNSSIHITFDETANLKSNEQKIITDKGETFISMFFGDAEEIIVENTIQTIKSCAFESVSCIKRVKFVETSTLSKIEDYAFQNSGLESIVLPDSLQSIAYMAFYRCKSLKSVKFGLNLKHVYEYAFSYCDALETIDFSGARSYDISQYAFRFDNNLTSVNFGDGVSSIGEYCFSDTKKLSTITLTASLYELKTYAFSNSGLTNVDMEKANVLEIPSFCFAKCTKLSSIKLSNCIQTLGSNCFSYTEISSIELSKSVQTIGVMCFRECSKLETFKIPEGSCLDTIEYGAFSGCFHFSTIILESEDNFALFNSALFDKNQTKLIIMPPNSPTKFFSFPETLIEIGPSSLLGCRNLYQVFLPSNSVSKIKEHAFENCTNLRSINIPQSVQFVGDDAFFGCKKLQCGILIENTSTSFRSDLVTLAKLPVKCIKSCEFLCTAKSRKSPSTWKNYFVFIIISQ